MSTTATILTQGHLVIPERILEALQLHAGNRLALSVEGDKLVLQRERPTPARLIEKDGRKLLEAPPDAPPMTPETVKALLTDFP